MEADKGSGDTDKGAREIGPTPTGYLPREPGWPRDPLTMPAAIPMASTRMKVIVGSI
jgi:hypothetical protein